MKSKEDKYKDLRLSPAWNVENPSFLSRHCLNPMSLYYACLALVKKFSNFPVQSLKQICSFWTYWYISGQCALKLWTQALLRLCGFMPNKHCQRHNRPRMGGAIKKSNKKEGGNVTKQINKIEGGRWLQNKKKEKGD